jgi:hypothetical protein
MTTYTNSTIHYVFTFGPPVTSGSYSISVDQGVYSEVILDTAMQALADTLNSEIAISSVTKWYDAYGNSDWNYTPTD